jgi:hypothetical protein
MLLKNDLLNAEKRSHSTYIPAITKVPARNFTTAPLDCAMENPASVIQKEEQERPKKGRRSKGKLHH